MNQFTATKLILEELSKAVEKFPKFPDDPIYAAAIVGEESGELLRAALKFSYEDGSHENLREEAIQTGAMAVRFLMHLYQMETFSSEQSTTFMAKQ